MANKTKLTPEILNDIKKMAEQGMNSLVIANKMGRPRQTIQNWCNKHGIVLQKRTSVKSQKIRLKFIGIIEEALKNNTTIKLNKVLREIGLHPDTAQKILDEKSQYRSVIRSKKRAITEDKTLDIELAQKRLPNQDDTIIGFSKGKYKIKAKDGFVYHKTSAKIEQGDPRGKSGSQLTEDQVKTRLLKEGYEYVRGFSGNIKQTVMARHIKCDNIRSTRLEGFFRQECPTCSNKGISLAELEILEWVNSLGFEAYSTRKIIPPKELDIYIPSLNIAIEYCGLYWHNEDSPQPRNKTYHYDKMKACEEKGVRLITIFEDEWRDRKSQIKNFLMSTLGKAERVVYARKCDVRSVEKTVARDFLQENHIQGKAPFKIAFGLYYDNILVGLITGNTHHRNVSSGSFVLNRLVFGRGVQVLGGASRLLKYLKTHAKNEGFKELISWSDNRWSQGNVYRKTGFKMNEHVKPDYSYFVGLGERQSKQSNTKNKLLAKGAAGTMENKEYELAKSMGYSRIWDCGKIRWSIDL